MNILAFVLAGGEGRRLYPLTAVHAKPALPFVNGYRIIDFVLSNLVNSGVTSIYVLAQHKPQSLIDHLGNSWASRFSARNGFLSVLRPGSEDLRYRGTADAVYKNRHLIERHRPNLVAVFAADHVYRMDIRQMVEYHRRCDAEVTVAAVPVPLVKASAFGVVVTNRNGVISEFHEKPTHPAAIPGDPARAYASMGNYLFTAKVLEELLEESNASGSTDFGRDVMPRLPGRRRAVAYDFSSNRLPGIALHEAPAYWRDVGTLEALSAAQQDASGPRPRFALHNPEWPILGHDDKACTTRRTGGDSGRPFENSRRMSPRTEACLQDRASTASAID